MALWSTIVSGFDTEDETVNFGTRITSKNNGVLFETCTIATIESNEKVTEKPHILATLQYSSRLCIAIDKSLTVFSNETCRDVLFNIGFDTLISCYCISQNGVLLFIVLTNGILYCLHVPSGGKIIFTRNVTCHTNRIIKIFVQAECDGQTNVMLIGENGCLYRISKLHIQLIDTACVNEDEAEIKELVKDIECVQLFNGLGNSKVICAAVGTILEELNIVLLTSELMYMWPNEHYSDFETLQYRYTKAQFLNSFNSLLCLRQDNALSIVCLQTLLGLKVYGKDIQDFTIIKGNDHNICEILLLMLPNELNTRILQLITYPGFEVKFQINVSTTFLVEIFDPNVEGILYVDCINDADECLDMVHIKTASSILPEYRLERLLKRGQFDAAEEFAINFKLPLEPIYCAKAAVLVEQLGPWAKRCHDPVELSTLINLLNKINDVQYVINCCNNAVIREYTQMKQLYLYARQRIVKSIEVVENTQHLNLLFRINETLNKLETFHMIWGHKIQDECYNEEMIKEWIRFSQADLMNVYKTQLSLGEMQSASLIWMRHFPGKGKKISIKLVQEIFAALSEHVNLTFLWPWLLNFVPTLLSSAPDAINEVVSWGYRKIKSLEKFHSTEWPQIGIDFGSRFIKLLKFKDKSSFLYFHQEYVAQNSILQKFMCLMQALSAIQELKVKYRMFVSLNTYLGEPMEVACTLLTKIRMDILSEFVNKFLRQYMLNNSLENDSVFSSYIQKTIRTRNWWYGEEAPWEKKVILVINFIHNLENRLQQTLEVLKRASVPWSSGMITLAEKNSNLDHSLSYKISIEYNHVSMKVILKKYGYENIGMSNRLISRIMKENRDEMLSDLSELTKNDKLLRERAFANCMIHCLSTGHIDKVIALLESLEDHMIFYCCTRIVNYIKISVPLMKKTDSATHYIDILGWIAFRLKQIPIMCKFQLYERDTIINTIEDLKLLCCLKRDYDVNITLKEYYMNKKGVLEKYVTQLCNDMEKGSLSLLQAHYKAVRIADNLKLNRLQATSLLVQHSENVDAVKYFDRLGEGHLDLTEEECRYTVEMCFTTLLSKRLNIEIAHIIENLTASALCKCSDVDLYNTLQSNVWAKLYIELIDKHHTVTEDVKCIAVPMLYSKLYSIYKDLAVTADHILLPLFKDTMGILIFNETSNNSTKQDKGHAVDIPYSTKEEMENFLSTLPHKLMKAQLAHIDYRLLQIVKTMHFGYCTLSNLDSTKLAESASVLAHYLFTLLKKIITARIFDLQLGLTCLFMLQKDAASKWISTASKLFQVDHARHLRVIILGYEYFRLVKDEALMLSFERDKVLHQWAQKLSNYSILYAETLNSDTSGKSDILQRVMACNAHNMIPLLEDFCSAFGFNLIDCLQLYLQTLVKTWNPKLFITSSMRKRELQISDDEVNLLREKCSVVADRISDRHALKECITSIWDKVNFYHYEVFLILMDLVKDKNVEKRNYFYFLLNYTRSGHPISIEYDAWVHLNPGHTELPPIAEWRLPYLPNCDLWKLITPELNLSTYKKWLDIAPVLKLQTHILCTLAVKGEISMKLESTYNNRQKEKWALYSKNSSLLKDIKMCIQCITEANALYYGTAVLYYVVNHTPPGADQVAAVQECYAYVQLAAEKCTTLEEGMLEKIKFKYLQFTSKHILYIHDLCKERYISLIWRPNELVRELYADESIPLRYNSITDYRPDINSAVDELGKLFSLNLLKLRLELLKEWLQPDSKYVNINESFTDAFSGLINFEQTASYDDNVYRACYVLEHGDIEQSANFLINIAFGNHEEGYSSDVQYRALHILQTMMDADKLEALTKRDLYVIRQDMKSLKYIGKLELLGLGYTMDSFKSCCKRELVNILWESQSYSSKALFVISEICIDFEIHEYALWNKILMQMTRLYMVNELKKILLQVRNIDSIINTNGYVAGWQAVILEPFKKLDTCPTLEQMENCTEILCLLHLCPIVHVLQLQDIVKLCFECAQAHLAIAILPYLNEGDRGHVLKTINDAYDISKVIEDFKKLSGNGVLITSHCSKILQRAFPQISVRF
ncbi:hypothetical protein KM043_002288 [Ampulex compressa]|nr:hypothetical protein KM043_002288 [Ampulex compressa]